MSDGMERIRFVRSVVFKGEHVGPGQEVNVTAREAFLMVEGYKDAVRVDGSARKAVSTTVHVPDGLDVIHGDGDAEHRDPVVQRPAQSRRRK